MERMGRFDRVLEPGLNILMPVLDSVKYVKTLKEVAVSVPSQSAITQGKNNIFHFKNILHLNYCLINLHQINCT